MHRYRILLVLNRRLTARDVYIMIVQYTGADTVDEIKRVLHGIRYEIKSKTLRGAIFEIAVEMKVNNKNLAFADRLRELEGVDSLTLVQYNGEYHG